MPLRIEAVKMEFLIVWLVACIVFAIFGGWIAVQKNRHTEEGVILGFLFGPLGCIVEAVLPSKDQPPPPSTWYRPPPPTPEEVARAEADRREYMACQEEANRRWEERQVRVREKMRQETEQRAAAAKRRWKAVGRWWDETVIHFGWFKALPDVVQPILVAALICVPLVAATVFALQRLLPSPHEQAVATVPSPADSQPPRPLQRSAAINLAVTSPVVQDEPTNRFDMPPISGFAREESTVTRIQERDSQTVAKIPKVVPWAEKLAELSAESKAFLRRYQSDGLESIFYMPPNEGPPRSLVELGAVIPEPGMRIFGGKIPYGLSQPVKDVLRKQPEITR